MTHDDQAAGQLALDIDVQPVRLPGDASHDDLLERLRREDFRIPRHGRPVLTVITGGGVL